MSILGIIQNNPAGQRISPFLLILLSGCLCFSASAVDLPRIGYVYPAGGQQGTTFEVKVGGENIYGTLSANVSGQGIDVQVLDSKDPDQGKGQDKKKQKKKNRRSLMRSSNSK